MKLHQIAVFLAASLCLRAEGPEAFRQTTASTTDRITFAPGGTIRVNDSFGHLMVDGWDQPEVEITVVKSMPFGVAKDRATPQLDKVQIHAEPVSPGDLTISTLPLRHRGKVVLDYQIHVPRDSKLVIHGSGYIMVSHVSGEIEATDRRGDIVVMLPDPGPYAIDAKTRLGKVLSDYEGDSHGVRFVGDRFASPTSSGAKRIYLRVGLGGITVKGLPQVAEVPAVPSR